MSKLLDDLIKQSRADAAAYEEFLKKAEASGEAAGRGSSRRTASRRCCTASPRRSCCLNNLGHHSRDDLSVPGRRRKSKAKLALELDLAMRENAPAGWKGDETREKQVLNALFPILGRDRAGDAGDLRDHQEPAGLLMSETIQLGDISIRGDAKDDQARPPVRASADGRVTLVAPSETRGWRWRAPMPITKLGWIREQQAKLREPGAGDAAAVRRAGEPLPLGTALPADGRLSGTPSRR